MFRKVALLIAVMIGCASSSFAYDTWGSRDHPLFRRPYGYDIADYVVSDGVLAIVGQPVFLSGKMTEITYYTQEWPLSPSELELRFIASLQKAGGEIVFREEPGLGGRYVAGKLSRTGRDVWVVQESTSLREYRLTLLETPKRVPAAPKSVASQPAAPLNDEMEAQVLDLLHIVDRTGVLELPARFASGSSTLPKGDATGLKKVAMLMEKDSSLKFRVSTYTDSNLKPSEQRALLRDRAAKLVDTLVGMGADKGRLAMDLSTEGAASRGVVRLTSVDSVDSPEQ
jgi:outer membrane protein OmpA-like peptidoglycan-associated protein